MSLKVDNISGDSLLEQLHEMKDSMNKMARAQEFAQQMATTGIRDIGEIAPDEKLNGVTVGQMLENISAQESVGKFEQLMKDALENVNVLQNESSSMQARFDVGDRSVTLADVMLASQKSSISFEATMQVRNKMVDAYKTIMQMQI